MDWNDTEIKGILKAYKTIFNTLDKDGNELTGLKNDLIEYLDLDKNRDYSVITSNFLDDEVKFIENLNKANIDYKEKLDVIKKELDVLNKKRKELKEEQENFFNRYFKEGLFKKTKDSQIGSSIGIDPLTDDLLLKSFDLGKKKVIIILGRDSYPCFGLDENKLYNSFQAPLNNYPMYNHPRFYKLFGKKEGNEFKLDSIIEGLMKNHIFLFLNLYPDFRPEFENTNNEFNPDPKFVVMAKDAKYTLKTDLDNCFDYCANRFESIIKIIQHNQYELNIKAIISLGRPVAKSLDANEYIYEDDSPVDKKKGIQLALDNPVLRYKYKSETLNINYIPIYHPYARNFTKKYNENYFKILGEVLKVDSAT